jgi:hypothetical protein
MATDILVELWNPISITRQGHTIVVPEELSTAHPWLFVQKYRGAAEGAKIPLGWEPSTTTFYDHDENFNQSELVVYTHLKAAYEKYNTRSAW